jgi:YidC/Oxa1 family membrane protein insertase
VNNDNRNFLTFAILAVLLLFAWPLVMNKIMPPANPPVTKIEGGKTQIQPNPNTPASSNPAAVRDLNLVLRETAAQRVAIDTPTLKGSINLKGARIDDLLLTRYKDTIDKNSPPIRLLSPAGTADAYFGEFGWTGDGVTAPGPDTVFSTQDAVLAPGKPVTLDWVNPAGLHFRIRFAIDENYMFTVDQLVGNGTAQPIILRPYALISRASVSKDAQSNNHIGPIGVFNDEVKYSITFENLQGQATSFLGKIWNGSAQPGANYFDNTGGWLGFGDKYWLAALIPAQTTAVHSGFPAKTNDHYQADVTPIKPITVAAGRGTGTRTLFFAGAKEVNLLDRYEDQLKIGHFGRAIDWGWFEIIEKPIFKYLDWLFRSIGNFGVAIMLLTVTIRLLIFPIAQRQFASMAQMRAIQPKMKALQEKHKDDKQRQQQEVMALYKTEGVNPLAGCLPTFLQIPIMYSLYKVLMVTIEMRHQPFVGWIKDLSAPDPLTPLNLFGILHFTPPQMIAIGVVPILLGISMWLQFKMNPQPMDDAQKQVFALMPWVLMFVMAPFAVGLQVYWITSNLLTVLQQRILYARHPALKQPVVK